MAVQAAGIDRRRCQSERPRSARRMFPCSPWAQDTAFELRVGKIPQKTFLDIFAENYAGHTTGRIHKFDVFKAQRGHNELRQAASMGLLGSGGSALNPHEEFFRTNFRNYAGVRSGIIGKARKPGLSQKAVMDEIILGRDIDFSGDNPHEEILRERNKDAAGKRAGEPFGILRKPGVRAHNSTMDQIILGRSITPDRHIPPLFQEWRKTAAGTSASRKEMWSYDMAGLKVDETRRLCKPGLRQGSWIGAVVFNQELSIDEDYENKFSDWAGFDASSPQRLKPRRAYSEPPKKMGKSEDGEDSPVSTSKRRSTSRPREFTDETLAAAQEWEQSGAASMGFETAQDAFSAIDKDRSGRITKDEIRHFFSTQGMDKDIADVILLRIDKDGDAKITAAEFGWAFGSAIEGLSDHELRAKLAKTRLKTDQFLKKSANQFRTVREAFRSLDKDKNGQIHYGEMLSWTQKHGLDASVANELFHRADGDANEAIGWKEFREIVGPHIEPCMPWNNEKIKASGKLEYEDFVYKANYGKPERVESAQYDRRHAYDLQMLLGDKMQNLPVAFREMDVDASGCISQAEVRNALGRQGFSSLVADEIFSRLDVDNNEKVTFAELQSLVPPTTPPPSSRNAQKTPRKERASSRGPSVEEQAAQISDMKQRADEWERSTHEKWTTVRDAFRQMDENKDLRISKPEMRTFMKMHGFGKDVADELFSRFDTDRNGSVSFQEVQSRLGPQITPQLPHVNDSAETVRVFAPNTPRSVEHKNLKFRGPFSGRSSNSSTSSRGSFSTPTARNSQKWRN